MYLYVNVNDVVDRCEKDQMPELQFFSVSSDVLMILNPFSLV